MSGSSAPGGNTVRAMCALPATAGHFSAFRGARRAWATLLGLALVGMLLVSQAGAAAALPPVSFASQDLYPPLNPFGNWEVLADPLDGLPPLCVETDVWTLGGGALLAPDINRSDEKAIQEYLGWSRERVETRFGRYLERHPDLDVDTEDLVLIDIEDAIGPSSLGRYNEEPALQLALIEALKMRIEVVRTKLPRAKLSLFNVVKPERQARYNSGFGEQMEGYRRAGRLGLFADLDYFSPSVYVRWGPEDRHYETIMAYTKMAIEESAKLPDAKPLAPFLSLRVFNPQSRHDTWLVSPEMADWQLAYLESHPNVERVVYWANPRPGREPDEPSVTRRGKHYVAAPEILSFFRALDPCGR